MSHAVPSFTSGQLLLLALPLLATACATSAPSQTPLMKSGGVSVSAEAMRVRMRALAPQMIASVEYAADQVRIKSTDPEVQRRALVWKLNTSTALSPTDTSVLSRWAKGLMMIQSLISLSTIVLLAARAVNIL